jgi:hypothetical protein
MVLVLLGSPIELSRIAALDLASPDPVRLQLPLTHPDDDFNLIALEYGCSLASVGIAQSDFVPPSESSDGGPIPAARAAYRAVRRHGDAIGQAEPISTSSAADQLASIHLPGAGDVCVNFVSMRSFDLAPFHIASLSLGSALVTGVESEPGVALVASFDRRFFRVSSSSITEVTGTVVPTSTPNLAAFRRDDGTLWWADDLGRTVTGPLGALRPGPSLELPPIPPFISLVGSPSDQTELFLLAPGLLYRLPPNSASGWEMIVKTGSMSLARHDVAWVGPGEAIAIGGHDSEADPRFVDHWTAAGGNIVESVPLPDADYLTSIARVPGVGVVAGSNNASLVAWQQSHWSLLPNDSSSHRIEWIAPIPSGFLFAQRELVTQFDVPTGRFCPEHALGSSEISRIVSVTNGVVLIPQHSDGAPDVVTYATYLPPQGAPPPECSR